MCFTINLQWARQNSIPCFSRFHHRGVVGRPNQHPIHDRLGRASPPIPLLWSKSTSFQKRPNLGRFLEIVPNWVAKTPHGYASAIWGQFSATPSVYLLFFFRTFLGRMSFWKDILILRVPTWTLVQNRWSHSLFRHKSACAQYKALFVARSTVLIRLPTS